MDFYSRQAQARSQTRWLIVAFVVSVALVTAALDVVLFTLFASTEAGYFVPAPLDFAARHPGIAFWCTIGILAVLTLSSLYKSLQLRGGGSVVAQSLGGVRVDRDVMDLKRKRLHNVVEEMAIASGVPMPEVYVLEQESAINAFAAGHTPANAAVAVTQGALDRLNREQLQGVIAHEFSHILNGDMRLNVQLMGWLFGLFVLALIGRTLLRVAPRGRRGAAGVAVVALAVLILGYLGLFAGRVLQAAVSRQRERLADASAVQFTRNPEGLKEALIRIAAAPGGSRIAAPNAEALAHMFFAQGMRRILATHPPIEERIRVLDPRFDVRDLPDLAAKARREMAELESGEGATAQSREAPSAAWGAQLSAASAVSPTSGAATAEAAPLAAPSHMDSIPGAIAIQVGFPQTIHIRHAHELRLALPERLREFVESSGRARALVLALLLSHDERACARQIALLKKVLPASELATIQETLPRAARLPPMLRLPALQQLFPALRRLPAEQRAALPGVVEQLIHADAAVEVFEFCLAKLLETLIEDELSARAPHGRNSLASATREIHVLFATLARFGAPDERRARMAYEAGMHTVLPMRRPPYATYENWPTQLGNALPVLEKLQPFAKKALIEGLVRTISHDEQLNVQEAELLRAVCALLHCPLPPLLPQVS